jgi:hypothetical protein
MRVQYNGCTYPNPLLTPRNKNHKSGREKIIRGSKFTKKVRDLEYHIKPTYTVYNLRPAEIMRTGTRHTMDNRSVAFHFAIVYTTFY